METFSPDMQFDNETKIVMAKQNKNDVANRKINYIN